MGVRFHKTSTDWKVSDGKVKKLFEIKWVKITYLYDAFDLVLDLQISKNKEKKINKRPADENIACNFIIAHANLRLGEPEASVAGHYDNYENNVKWSMIGKTQKFSNPKLVWNN